MKIIVYVKSTICGFTHMIKGNFDGQNINIDIETQCEMVKKMSSMKVPMLEILDIKDNYVMDMAQEARCCPGCLVPTGILNLCMLESGMIAKSLAKQVKMAYIEFKEEEQSDL
ncbi:MAG: hypothetical protein JW705_05555 [Methanosarcinaceae archaeon]|nr:hypothetical protein [Methanosarcinaceae archaeon]